MSTLPALQMNEEELFKVLSNSLYVGAQQESIKMVIGYCKASGLDPMQKPVHIVPMWDKNAKQMRDVIMPGVGLYRTQAARSNALAGISEPEFGPAVEFKLNGGNFSAPEWCRVVVKRLLTNGAIADFSALEYWIENYATAGKDSDAPNAMWKKRPRAQLAKCAQAQALRMAFPEMTGGAPTADEMEGKEIDITPSNTFRQVESKSLPEYSSEKFEANQDAWQTAIDSGKHTPESIINMISTKHALSDEQIKTIKEMGEKEHADA